MKGALGEDYVERLRKAFESRLPKGVDLVCYWFEKAGAAISGGHTVRAGLVATNSIRGGANRKVLDRICANSTIFEAWSDEPWVLEGAAVRVSLICFKRDDSGSAAKLNGNDVHEIFSDLTARTSSNSADLTSAVPLKENEHTAFNGIQKTGPFEIPGKLAREWITNSHNPHGLPNSEVLKPYWNGIDITRRPRESWIIDFGFEKSEADAALYELPFQYALKVVKPVRDENSLKPLRDLWWRHWRPRPEMQSKIARMRRYIVTAEVSKHRIFQWSRWPILADKNLIVITREDDITFGILHSKFHELWALRMGTSLEDRPRYTPSSTFETFPFPTGLTPNVSARKFAKNERAIAIASAAKQLNELRENWLNPSELVRIEHEVAPGYPDRIIPRSEIAERELRKRTLTNLYNQRPQWLQNAHRLLDEAVAQAYGWKPDISDDEVLANLLALNLHRAPA
jgi:type II restriction/modification system DNA methylase subunit YeeA